MTLLEALVFLWVITQWIGVAIAYGVVFLVAGFIFLVVLAAVFYALSGGS